MTHIMLATNVDSYQRTTVTPEAQTKILVCNAGSSSLKFSLFDAENEAEVRARLADDPWADGTLAVESIEPWSVWLRSPPG